MFNLFSCSSLRVGNLNDCTSDHESNGLSPTEKNQKSSENVTTNWMGHLTQSNKGVTSSMWEPRLPPTIEGLYRTGEILPQSEHLCSFQCSKIVLINDYRGWSPSATSLPSLVLCPAPLNFIWMLIILHMQNHRDHIVYQSPLHLIGTRLIIILLL